MTSDMSREASRMCCAVANYRRGEVCAEVAPGGSQGHLAADLNLEAESDSETQMDAAVDSSAADSTAAELNSSRTLELQSRSAVELEFSEAFCEHAQWHDDVAHDSEQRRAFTEQLGGQPHTEFENGVIENGLALHDMHDHGNKLQLGSTLDAAYTTSDSKSGLLTGHVECLIRGAPPEEVLAYLADLFSRHMVRARVCARACVCVCAFVRACM